MDDRFVQRVRAATNAVDDRKARLRQALAEIAEAPTEVAAPLPASGDPSRMRVVIELDDLIELIEAMAAPPSLEEALREEGFVPAGDAKPVPRQGHPRNPLKRYRVDQA